VYRALDFVEGLSCGSDVMFQGRAVGAERQSSCPERRKVGCFVVMRRRPVNNSVC
jgi:hypothetical protein